MSRHGLPDWLFVQTFYNGLNYPTKINIDATAGETLMGKSTEDAQALIGEMTFNNYQWANERGNSTRVVGMYEIDTLKFLSPNLENMFNS